MAGSTTEERQRAVLRDLAERLTEAIEVASPLCTYAEIKDLLATQYYRYVVQMRRDRGLTWREVAGPAGMTPQGIHKLGDKRPPVGRDNPIRRMLALVQEAGPEGIGAGDLAGRFYDARPRPADGEMTFDEILDCLASDAEIRRGEEGVWIATDPAPVASLAAIREVLLHLHSAPERGMSFGELAKEFYGQRSDEDRTDLAHVLGLLVETGDIKEVDGRYVAGGEVSFLQQEGAVPERTIRSMVRTTSRIGGIVRANSGAHDAQLFRLTFHVGESQHATAAALHRIQTGILDLVVTIETEALVGEGATREMTLVHGAAPGLQ